MIARSIALATAATWLLLVLAPAAEAATCEKTSLIDIQDEVMCVICGVPLVNAGGPQSDNQREFIRERADRCESKQEIKNALVAEYGPEVLAMPQKSGFDLTAYLVPILALAAALVAIVLGAIGWRRSSASKAAAADADSAGSADLDADMQRYDL